MLSLTIALIFDSASGMPQRKNESQLEFLLCLVDPTLPFHGLHHAGDIFNADLGSRLADVFLNGIGKTQTHRVLFPRGFDQHWPFRICVFTDV